MWLDQVANVLAKNDDLKTIYKHKNSKNGKIGIIYGNGKFKKFNWLIKKGMRKIFIKIINKHLKFFDSVQWHSQAVV